MQLLQQFDATTVDPTQGPGQLPIGRHPVVISGSEIKATKAQNGGMLELELSITDGPSKGEKGAYRLNLYNPNQQAVAIAQRQLSALCHVTGVFKVADSSQLHNIPFIVEVGYQDGQGPNAPQGENNKGYTEVKRVFDIHGNEPGKKPANAAQPPQPAPAAAPAWNAPTQAPQAPAPAAAPAWAPPANPNSAAGFPQAPLAPQAAAQSAPWQQAPATPAGKPPWA